MDVKKKLKRFQKNLTKQKPGNNGYISTSTTHLSFKIHQACMFWNANVTV
jgi:hypothetical protein